MATSDLVQVLKMIAGVVSNPALTPDTVKAAKTQIKEYIADKTWLQDPEILSPLDKILEFGAAAQVPASFVAAGFNPADYVEPKPEKNEKAEKSAPAPEPTKPHAPPDKHH